MIEIEKYKKAFDDIHAPETTKMEVIRMISENKRKHKECDRQLTFSVLQQRNHPHGCKRSKKYSYDILNIFRDFQYHESPRSISFILRIRIAKTVTQDPRRKARTPMTTYPI